MKHVAGGGRAAYRAVKSSSSWKSFSFISASAPALAGNAGGRGITVVIGVWPVCMKPANLSKEFYKRV